MTKLLVIGATGLIGSRFVELSKTKFDITSVDEKVLDITNLEAVQKYFGQNKFDAVVNFAAYTNVDGAEGQKGDKEGLCYKLNVAGPKNLMDTCNKFQTFLLHISTDFVFPGNNEIPGPYDEDTKLPGSQGDMGWYGWTKRLGEVDQKCIVRIGYPFSASEYSPKVDWARKLIKLYNEDKLYPLFTDQVYSVIFIDDLVAPMVKIIENKMEGVFHIASNTTSPYEIGKYLLEKYAGKEVKIQKGSMVEFLKSPGSTPRPIKGGLKTEKTQEKLGMKFPTWREMVDEFNRQTKM